MTAPQSRIRRAAPLVCLLAVFILLKLPLLRTPYFWDDMGYVMTMAHHYYTHGLHPIAHLERSPDPWPARLRVDSGHPPLFFLTVAALWRITGPDPAVPRLLVLLLAAVGLGATFRLARILVGEAYALPAALLVATSPLFFAQSGTIHLDVPLASLTAASLLALLEDRRAAFLTATTAMLLVKYQGILTMPAIVAVVLWRARRRGTVAAAARHVALHCTPLAIWLLWKVWHYVETGVLLTRNPHNVRLEPSLALLLHQGARSAYHSFFHRGNVLLTAAALIGLAVIALRRRSRPRWPKLETALLVGLPIATVFLFHAVVQNNGARYHLPSLPLLAVAACWGLRQLGVVRPRAIALALAPMLAFQVSAWHGQDPLLVGLARIGAAHPEE